MLHNRRPPKLRLTPSIGRSRQSHLRLPRPQLPRTSAVFRCAVLASVVSATPFATSIAGLAASNAFGRGETIAETGLFTGLAIGVAISASVYLVAKVRAQCPKCKKWFRAEIERSDLIGQDVRTVRGTTNVQVREGYDRSGPVVANVQIPTQRTEVTGRYAVHRRCLDCGHRWATRQ